MSKCAFAKKEELGQLWKILQKHESKLQELSWHRNLRPGSNEPSNKPALERHTYYGVHLAHCIETRDPLKQGRVRYYSPVLHLPDTPLDGLDWAWPISAMGGFDDSGMTWVPPAGSTLCLLFQNGSPDGAFYIGTTWHRDRGPVGLRQWGIPVPEFERIYEGHRGGYMVGRNDESQVFQPWNCDQYQGFDLDDNDYDNQVNAQLRVTWPHMYGFKTPEKHALIMDDGDPKCNRRWKRLQLQSSLGHLFLMKDDPYCGCGDWLNPKCTDTEPEEDPTICTPTIYEQWEIIDAFVTGTGAPDFGPISITIDGSVGDGDLVAIPQLDGIEGAEGTWVVVGGGSTFELLDSFGLTTDFGFFPNPDNPIYAIRVDEDGIPVQVAPAQCDQGPENCPTTQDNQTDIIEGLQTGFIKSITATVPAVIETEVPHNLSEDTKLTITGAQGMYNINGNYTISNVGPTSFEIDNTTAPVNDPSYIQDSAIWIITVEDEYLGTEHLCPSKYRDEDGNVIWTGPADSGDYTQPCSTRIKEFECANFSFTFNNKGKNKYHKHRQECFPILRSRCALSQSGIQIMSLSGATIVFDDSVEEPKGRPEWEQALHAYDMDGCTGVFKGRTFWASATDHVIELNDHEDQHGIRGKRNGINMHTACGNYICMSDHSLPCCQAGDYRGIHIGSTSKHTFDMVDHGNLQCSRERRGCAKPTNRASHAWVRLRSGYGITLTMNDGYSQTNTDQQYFQILSPQKDNTQRGAHVLHMQEKPTGPGQIFLRAGGDFIVHTYDDMVEVTGVDHGPHDKHLANRFEFVTNRKIVSVGDYIYSKAKNHLFWSDENIFLLAGEDCKDWDEDGNLVSGPCIYPVVVACQAIPEFVTKMCGIKASERVFASAKPCKKPCLLGGEIGTNTLTTGGGETSLTTGEDTLPSE